MKILTLNFLTCAVKACKSSSASFPLHPKDAELVQDSLEPNPKLLINILPRIDWAALVTVSSEVRDPLSYPMPIPSHDILSPLIHRKKKADKRHRIAGLPRPPADPADGRRVGGR